MTQTDERRIKGACGHVAIIASDVSEFDCPTCGRHIRVRPKVTGPSDGRAEPRAGRGPQGLVRSPETAQRPLGKPGSAAGPSTPQQSPVPYGQQSPAPYGQQPYGQQPYGQQPGQYPAQQAYATQQPYPQPQTGGSAPITSQGAWGLWWIVLLTGGIYYYIWYARINKELSEFLGRPVDASGQWWSQLIPIYQLVALASTAARLNAAHALVGSPTRVSPFVTWFWAPGWFGSQTRYLQRRINVLHDIQASHGQRQLSR